MTLRVTSSDLANNPELQQRFWLAGAYAFLNGDYYSSRYGYPSMSYGMYSSPYYTPSYTFIQCATRTQPILELQLLYHSNAGISNSQTWIYTTISRIHYAYARVYCDDWL